MELLKKFGLCLIILAVFISSGMTSSDFETQNTFRNPIHTFVSPIGCADPHIYHHTDNWYYWARCGPNNTIVLFKSQDVTDWFSPGSMNRTIYAAPRPTDAALIEPKIHFIGREWFVYFAMTLDGIREHRQNFVINSAEAFGPYGGDAIRLDCKMTYAIHGSLLQHTNGQLYFLWAGGRNATSQSSKDNGTEYGIYITKMASPLQITGSSILLRKPMSSWEDNGILESPAILQNFDRTCLTYSDILNRKAGLICIEDWKHPLVTENWVQLGEGPHFWDNEEEHVFLNQGGKISFTTSSDRTQSWMVYKAYDQLVGGSLSIRLERFGWLNGYPSFPRPTGLDKDITMPSSDQNM